MLRAWIVILLSFAWATGPLPFWKSKEKIYERVKNGDVVVSVTRHDGREGRGRHRLNIAGGGWVRAPREFVMQKAFEFDRLAKASGYIDSAVYDAAEQKLSIAVSAYGRKAQMQVRLRSVKDVEPKRIDYEILNGPLRGLKGAFEFTEIGSIQTEVGIVSEFHYDELPLPKFFIEFGLEVVFQKMAVNLRNYVEHEFK